MNAHTACDEFGQLPPGVEPPSYEPDRRETEETQKEAEERQKDTERIQKITDSSSVVFSTLPSSSVLFLCSSVSIENEGRITAAIVVSIPSEVKQRRRKLFDLARRLLAITKGRELSVEDQLAVFDQWWKLSEATAENKSYEKSMNTFLASIEKAKTPLDDIIANCLEDALAKEPPDWSKRFNLDCQKLASLCRELQLINGDDPFFLSCRVAGSAVGVAHETANKYLQLFTRLKKIVVVEQGSVGGGRATRYRYIAAN